MPKTKANGHPTLLDRALQTPLRRKAHKPVESEEIDLTLAWLADRVSLVQVSAALYPDEVNPGSKTLSRMATCMREAYRRGIVQIKAK